MESENNILRKVNEDVSYFIISNNIKYIGNKAFSNCKKLKKIEIPNSVVKIGNYAFNACENIEFINIPDSVEYIGKYCFYDCENLKQIILPTSLTKIESFCFAFCRNLISIKAPSLRYIGNLSLYETPFYELYNSDHLTYDQFTDFIRAEDKFKYVKNGILKIKDITFLLNKKKYKGLKQGLNYGI